MVCLTWYFDLMRDQYFRALLCEQKYELHFGLRHSVCSGVTSDYVLMEGRGFGFVTFTDPAHAQSFLEVGVKVQKIWLST